MCAKHFLFEIFFKSTKFDVMEFVGLFSLTFNLITVSAFINGNFGWSGIFALSALCQFSRISIIGSGGLTVWTVRVTILTFIVCAVFCPLTRKEGEREKERGSEREREGEREREK